MVPTSKACVPNLGTPVRKTQITSFSSTHFPISQISPTNSFVHQISPHINSIYKMTKDNLNVSGDDNGNEATIPTMTDIINSSKAQKLDLKLQTLGPFFRITARSLETQADIGRADGLIRVWLGGKILHLDSIRLQRETLGMEKPILGIGVLLGAVAIRYGYDCGCGTAELLAINDSDLYHSKLVRFYTRIGFKAVYEVTGSSIGDFAHRLVWGGVGTRMEANVQDLLIRWCTRFIPRTGFRFILRILC